MGPQPPYNTAAAVTALRLARSVANDNMRPSHLTYQAYWEWSKNKGQTPRGSMDKDEPVLTDRLESSSVVSGIQENQKRVQERMI